MSLLPLIFCFVMYGGLNAEKVVENGPLPSKGSHTLLFEEDLRIGSEEENYLWASEKTDIAVSETGEILVADPKANEVRLYDENGKFLRRVAGPGTGPGELQGLNKIQVLADGGLVIFEQKPGFSARITFFDKNFAFIRTINPVNMGVIPLYVTFNPTGEYYTGTVMTVKPHADLLTTKTGISRTESFELIHAFSSHASKANFSGMSDPSTIADMVGDVVKGLYAESGVFAFDRDGNLYTALNNRYEIVKYGPDFTTRLMKIKRQYKPLLNTEQEKRALVEKVADDFRESPMAHMVTDNFVNRMLKAADLPDAKLPISNIAVTPEGYLLVVHDLNRATGAQTVDIFDRDGVYKGQASLKNWAFLGRDTEFRMVFKNGYAYTVENNADNDVRVVRYRYKLVKDGSR